MKALILAFLIVITLVYPSNQLQCYSCRSDIYTSTLAFINDLPLCSPSLNGLAQTVNVTNGLIENKCKKLVEKIRDNEYISVHVVRTYGPKSMGLNSTIFEEYTCDTDLCNRGTTMNLTMMAILTSFVTVAAFHL